MNRLSLAVACLALLLPVAAEDLARLTADLEAEDFKVRQAAVAAIAAAGDEDPGVVIRHLCSKDAKLGPESMARIPDILGLMFQRQCLGVGEPETGMKLRLYLEAGSKEGITKVQPILEEVAAESSAAKAGLRKGDVIVAWNGKPIEGDDCVIRLRRMIRQAGPGAKVAVQVRRMEIVARPRVKGGGSLETIALELGKPSPEAPDRVHREVFAGWLQRMRMEHGLPEKYAVPQP